MPASPVTSRRIAMVAVCLVSLLACCSLAWWQWERFSSASGTFQNLGYVLQWPLFGLFPAFVFWRIRRLRGQAEQREPDGSPAAEPEIPAPPPLPAALPTVAEPDDELAAYNRYLAELNARDRQNR